MLVGKNSWKGLLLLLYVALTIVAAVGCFIQQDTFFNVVGVLLIVCNGYVTFELYKALQNAQ